MAKSKVSPMKATFRELCRMRREVKTCRNFSILTDTYTVWISEQQLGKERTQHIEISRAIFNRLIKWYVEESLLGAEKSA